VWLCLGIDVFDFLLRCLIWGFSKVVCRQVTQTAFLINNDMVWMLHHYRNKRLKSCQFVFKCCQNSTECLLNLIDRQNMCIKKIIGTQLTRAHCTYLFPFHNSIVVNIGKYMWDKSNNVRSLNPVQGWC